MLSIKYIILSQYLYTPASMEIYKRLMLIFAMIIFIYITFRFLRRRREISHLRNKIHIEGLKNKDKCKNATCAGNDLDRVEGFGSPEAEYNNLIEPNPVSITSMSKEYIDQPLKEYVIKGSYNSAITGNYVNTEMVKYVLTRGCRYLDFEVLYIDEKPFVTYTTDNKFETIKTENKIVLDRILTSVVAQAFTQPIPNFEDPLFIHLRLKSNDVNIYKSVAKSIDATLRGKLYSKKITDATKLSDVMGKIVVVMDKPINRKYENDSMCKGSDKDCYKLTNYINLDSGSETLYQNTYTDILNQSYTPVNMKDKCDICTDVKHNRMVVPDKMDNTSNPNTYELIGNHGCQVVMCRFYIKDDNLYNYEKLFDDNKGGIVPLLFASDYIKKEGTK